jgi:hypothetical protein
MNKSGEYKKRDFSSARDWHIFHVYNDPDFISDFDKLDIHNDDTSKITKKYSITGYDLLFFEIRSTLYLEKNVQRKGSLTFNPKTGKHILEFDYSISKSEFMEFWTEFVTLRDTLVGFKLKSKRKSPENHELIYAIFKARKTYSFPEIYKMYTDGKLPSYTGSIADYLDEDKLQAYYDKYKPSNF